MADFQLRLKLSGGSQSHVYESCVVEFGASAISFGKLDGIDVADRCICDVRPYFSVVGNVTKNS